MACFKKIADRNPGYQTVVGNIGIKYANEIMFAYQIYLAYADQYAASLKLPVNLYPSQQLDTARKILQACPQNAILLAFGDNDYYPVHYLQKSLGIRKDVYLVHYSLLGADRYIKRATYPQYEAQGIRLSVDTSLYKGDKNGLISIFDSARLFDFANIATLLRSQPDSEWNAVRRQRCPHGGRFGWSIKHHYGRRFALWVLGRWIQLLRACLG